MQNKSRTVLVTLAMLVMALGCAVAARAQGFYYKEIRKDDRIYVFNIEANADRFEKTGESGVGITMIGAGPNGETVVGDNERALQLFFYKHDIPMAIPDPPPPRAPAPPWRISGYMFGDYYYFTESHDSKWQDQQGFWMRRAYLSYDHTWTPRLATRLRLEMNSNGTLAGGNLTPYVKDAYLRWTYYGRQQVYLGIQPTATFNFIEELWGLRHIEKTPLDLYGIDGSRDFGLSFDGPIGQSGSVRYVAQFGNESGQGSETDKYKATRLGLRYAPPVGLQVEGIYVHANRALDADRDIYQLFGGYRAPSFRVGAHYSRQNRNAARNSTSADLELDIYSFFGVVDLKRSKWTLFGRFDRFDDPNPGGAGIAYLPIDPRVPYNFTLAGLEYYLHQRVRFSPNFELVTYDDLPNGTSIKKDVVARVTFYFVFP